LKLTGPESIMKEQHLWQRHLQDLMNVGLDPLIYAVQWAQDPRCLQRGARHRRVGSFSNDAVCRLWAAGKLRNSWT
jgi:hypothetical protein